MHFQMIKELNKAERAQKFPHVLSSSPQTNLVAAGKACFEREKYNNSRNLFETAFLELSMRLHTLQNELALFKLTKRIF